MPPANSAVKCGLENCRKKAGRLKDPWRGVNLGGWLILEPGTAVDMRDPDKQNSLFDLSKDAPLHSEYDLMCTLRKICGCEREVKDILKRHRESYLKSLLDDGFKRMKDYHLNAVRIPIPWWIIQEEQPFSSFDMDDQDPDPYIAESDALEKYIDKAVAGAKKYGLQVVLDLHAAPGGENDGAPCGRKWSEWEWRKWCRKGSVEALDRLAMRYGNKELYDNVTGIEVCNEPSEKVPTHIIYEFYEDAVKAIRRYMPHDRVTIILPNFKRGSMQNFINYAKGWQIFSKGAYSNVVFDFHFYHCFGRWWQSASLSDQLREVIKNGRLLASVPAVVGEWSLGLGAGALSGEFVEIVSKRAAQITFKELQLDTYACASHGWFFWNWVDRGGDGIEWDFQKSFDGEAWDKNISTLARSLPSWNGEHDDPLDIRNGDSVVLRSYHGKCVSTYGKTAQPVNWFACNAASFRIVTIGAGPDGFQEDDGTHLGSTVRDGYVVRFRRNRYPRDAKKDNLESGEFLAVNMEDKDDIVVREFAKGEDLSTTEFIIHVVEERKLRHCGAVFLQSRKTFKLVVAEQRGDLHAEWMEDYATWQNFSIEKKFDESPPADRPRVDFNECTSPTRYPISTPVRKRRRDSTLDDFHEPAANLQRL